MKRLRSSIFTGCLCVILSLWATCTTVHKKDEKSPVDYVNPYIGNISHLLVPTYPTIHLPNSMLRVCPGRDDYTSDLISGLPIALTSHRGSSAFALSPAQGEEGLDTVISYSYDNEKLTPYSYYVHLDELNATVKYAPSYRAGIYQINFEKPGNNKLVINTRNGALTAAGNSVSGYQIIDNTPTRIYLYLETEQKPTNAGILSNNKPDFSNQKGTTIVLDMGEQKTVNIRYGVSFINADQAKNNLQGDINTYDVNKVAEAGFKVWNDVLGKIAVKGGSDEDKALFYTSLYRTYERMINISEDGKYYSAFDGKIHDDNGTPFYTDDWVWDTYRATHPLRILIEPEMEENMIKSYLRMAGQSPHGWMPTFPGVTGDSHCMNGNHAVAVIWDAYCKGLTGFDLEAAYHACKSTITEKTLLPWQKIPITELDRFYKEKGYFPALKPNEAETCKDVHSFERRQSISIILGNSYDNWCLAQIAKTLGKTEDYKQFLKASYSYRNVYNNKTAFFHPKDKNGDFIIPFDYRFSGGQGTRDYYGENNGWIYRWDVQHNPEDLITLMGGREQFIENLNNTFREPLGESKFNFYHQLPDHTGNVGQFSMANEPCLHIPYLYNYAGQPWMTQKRIRTLLDQWFRSDLMGIPGDEDGGGMSAFVVFSMMGFYPVTPGSPTYNIGSPVFERIKLNLGADKYFEISAENYAPGNKYIQSATLNGTPLNKPWFHHKDIANGGTLVLTMGDKANKEWGASPEDAPPSSEKLEMNK
jgi:predicted alpha-1,2-mannosidase